MNRWITKSSGEKVPYDAQRIYRSLKRVHTNEPLIQEIINEVDKLVRDGMSTQQIYRIAFRLLRKKAKTTAARYHLKRAIMKLGETGYPFEKFIAELFQKKNFSTQNNMMIAGYCVQHEVDVVARREQQYFFVECKYHHRLGLKCDLKIALYVKARFLDIEHAFAHEGKKSIHSWLITNTRFTQDAIKYARCAPLKIMGWDYPQKNNLKNWIESSGLYPITCITHFTKNEIHQLLAQNILLCQTVCEQPEILDQLQIATLRKQNILKQCIELSQNKNESSFEL